MHETLYLRLNASTPQNYFIKLLMQDSVLFIVLNKGKFAIFSISPDVAKKEQPGL